MQGNWQESSKFIEKKNNQKINCLLHFSFSHNFLKFAMKCTFAYYRLWENDTGFLEQDTSPVTSMLLLSERVFSFKIFKKMSDQAINFLVGHG